jgi:hypothetical protein
MLCAFFYVIPRRLNFIYRRFETLSLFYLYGQVGVKNSSHLLAYEDGTDRVFLNVGIQNSDAKELPRRRHTTYFILIFYAILKSVFLWLCDVKRTITHVSKLFV